MLYIRTRESIAGIRKAGKVHVPKSQKVSELSNFTALAETMGSKCSEQKQDVELIDLEAQLRFRRVNSIISQRLNLSKARLDHNMSVVAH